MMKEMIEQDFSPHSKVWIYQSERPFSAGETEMLNKALSDFVKSWTAHNQQLKGVGKVIEDRFILLMVDETQATASGCSIDTSVKFMKKLAAELQVDFFNRFLFSFRTPAGIVTRSVSDASSLLRDGHIDNKTEVFNCLVFSKAEFDAGFVTTFENSWLKQYIN